MSAQQNPDMGRSRSCARVTRCWACWAFPSRAGRCCRAGWWRPPGFWLADPLGRRRPAAQAARRRAADGQGQGRSFRSGCGADRRTSTRSTRNRRRATTICGPLAVHRGHQCPGLGDRRVAAASGQAGRQVRADPQHDARPERSRDGRLHGPDRQPDGRQAGVSARRGRRVQAERLRSGLRRTDSALRRAHRAAGPVLGSGIPGAALQAVCHRRRSRRSRGSWWKVSSRRGSRTSGSAAGANC